MLEFFQYTLGWLWYSQISKSAHGWDPLHVAKSVNIRAILKVCSHDADAAAAAIFLLQQPESVHTVWLQLSYILK